MKTALTVKTELTVKRSFSKMHSQKLISNFRNGFLQNTARQSRPATITTTAITVCHKVPQQIAILWSRGKWLPYGEAFNIKSVISIYHLNHNSFSEGFSGAAKVQKVSELNESARNVRTRVWFE